jgi:hypothetical protein
MADVLKFERKGRPGGDEIPAALREFIDAVIVPALVREYLGEMNVSKNLAPPSGVVSDSSSDVRAFSEVRR